MVTFLRLAHFIIFFLTSTKISPPIFRRSPHWSSSTREFFNAELALISCYVDIYRLLVIIYRNILFANRLILKEKLFPKTTPTVAFNWRGEHLYITSVAQSIQRNSPPYVYVLLVFCSELNFSVLPF